MGLYLVQMVRCQYFNPCSDRYLLVINNCDGFLLRLIYSKVSIYLRFEVENIIFSDNSERSKQRVHCWGITYKIYQQRVHFDAADAPSERRVIILIIIIMMLIIMIIIIIIIIFM